MSNVLDIELRSIPVTASGLKPRKHNEVADALVAAAIENIGMCAVIELSALPKTYSVQPGTPISNIGKRLGVPPGFRLRTKIVDDKKNLAVWLAPVKDKLVSEEKVFA